MTKASKGEPSPGQKHRTGWVQRGWKSKLPVMGLCVYWPTIFIISHIPKRYVPRDVTVSGRAVHILAYFVLTLLVFISAGSAGSASFGRKKTWILISIIACYAAFDEILQRFIEGRSGSPVDWAVDVFACLLCVVVLRLLAGVRRRQFAKKSQG